MSKKSKKLQNSVNPTDYDADTLAVLKDELKTKLQNYVDAKKTAKEISGDVATRYSEIVDALEELFLHSDFEAVKPLLKSLVALNIQLDHSLFSCLQQTDYGRAVDYSGIVHLEISDSTRKKLSESFLILSHYFVLQAMVKLYGLTFDWYHSLNVKDPGASDALQNQLVSGLRILPIVDSVLGTEYAKEAFCPANMKREFDAGVEKFSQRLVQAADAGQSRSNWRKMIQDLMDTSGKTDGSQSLIQRIQRLFSRDDEFGVRGRLMRSPALPNNQLFSEFMATAKITYKEKVSSSRYEAVLWAQFGMVTMVKRFLGLPLSQPLALEEELIELSVTLSELEAQLDFEKFKKECFHENRFPSDLTLQQKTLLAYAAYMENFPKAIEERDAFLSKIENTEVAKIPDFPMMDFFLTKVDVLRGISLETLENLFDQQVYGLLETEITDFDPQEKDSVFLNNAYLSMINFFRNSVYNTAEGIRSVIQTGSMPPGLEEKMERRDRVEKWYAKFIGNKNLIPLPLKLEEDSVVPVTHLSDLIFNKNNERAIALDRLVSKLKNEEAFFDSLDNPEESLSFRVESLNRIMSLLDSALSIDVQFDVNKVTEFLMSKSWNLDEEGGAAAESANLPEDKCVALISGLLKVISNVTVNYVVYIEEQYPLNSPAKFQRLESALKCQESSELFSQFGLSPNDNFNGKTLKSIVENNIKPRVKDIQTELQNQLWLNQSSSIKKLSDHAKWLKQQGPYYKDAVASKGQAIDDLLGLIATRVVSNDLGGALKLIGLVKSAELLNEAGTEEQKTEQKLANAVKTRRATVITSFLSLLFSWTSFGVPNCLKVGGKTQGLFDHLEKEIKQKQNPADADQQRSCWPWCKK